MSPPVPEVRGYHDVRPLPGGHSGEIFLGVADTGPEAELVLRVYGAGARRRGPEAPGVQAGVLRLVAGLVPAPRLVEWRSAEYGAETGLLVTTRLPGVPLVDVLPSAPTELQHRLGASMGEVLGRLSGIAQPGVGSYLDHRLTLGPYPAHAESLVGWFDHLHRGTELELLYPHEAEAVRRLCEQAETLLAVSPRACLVHGDLSARNVLCDPDTGEITGLVDWEFAHAGHPVEDLGRLLRKGSGLPFVDATVEAMRPWLPGAERAPVQALKERARAADLYWLVETASRRGESPATYQAYDLLKTLAATGRLLGELP